MGFGLIGIILVVVLIVVLIGWQSQGDQSIFRNSVTPSDTPREILEKRYARGEISKQEFEQIKADLE